PIARTRRKRFTRGFCRLVIFSTSIVQSILQGIGSLSRFYADKRAPQDDSTRSAVQSPGELFAGTPGCSYTADRVLAAAAGWKERDSRRCCLRSHSGI